MDDARENAIRKIQKLHRRNKLKSIMSTAFWQKAWNELDVDEENETVQAEAEIDEILENLQKKRDERKEKLMIAQQNESPATSDPRFDIDLDAYEGPVFSGASVSEDQVSELVNFIKEGGHLPYQFAHLLISNVLHDLLESPTMSNVYIPENGRLTVVGDIHGQLEDLLTIFRLNGMPSKTSAYIFNGDFVDRGKMGMEVLLILYALKLAYPTTVHLNRGNHEQRRLNGKYGFEDEVRTKYDSDLFDLIQQSFSALPLCSLIEKRILVLHGGLFRDDGITLDDLMNISRPRDLPRGKRTGPDSLLESILWSDPRDIDGRLDSTRGAGIQFGSDVTKDFLDENSLELLIRSHEVEHEGYRVQHDNRLITIFSCSNYCGTNDNYGAVISFTENVELKPHFINYHADSSLVAKRRKRREKGEESGESSDDEIPENDITVRNQRCQTQTLKKLREKIFHNRHELLLCFSNIDTESTGYVSRLDWANTLRSVLNLNIPWLRLQPYFVQVESKEKRIKYRPFLEKYRVSSRYTESWLHSVVHKVCKRIYGKFGDLTDVFNTFDKDHDGKLSYMEFTEEIQECDVGLSNDQLYELMRSIDRNNNNEIELDEFKKCFQLEFDQLHDEEAEHLEELKEVGERLLREFHKRSHGKSGSSSVDLGAAFKHTVRMTDHAEEDDDHISYEDFSVKLLRETLGLTHYSDEKCLKLAKYIDKNHSGSISLREFENAFKVTCSADGWQEEVLQRLSGMFFHGKKTHLKALFRALDVDHSGSIDYEEFKMALETLQASFSNQTEKEKKKGSPIVLEEYQIQDLFDTIDQDGNGRIDYDEFLDSFKLQVEVDEEEQNSSKKKKKKHHHHHHSKDREE